MRYKKERRRRRKASAGFTLMEVLLVLVILVILGSMAASMFGGTQARAQIRAAESQIGIFKRQIELYNFDMRQYPATLEALVEKPTDLDNPERWGGPYLDVTTLPLDPWDNEYKFASPGKRNTEKFDVWSMGPDGQDGTEGDIGNWESSN